VADVHRHEDAAIPAAHDLLPADYIFHLALEPDLDLLVRVGMLFGLSPAGVEHEGDFDAVSSDDRPASRGVLRGDEIGLQLGPLEEGPAGLPTAFRRPEVPKADDLQFLQDLRRVRSIRPDEDGLALADHLLLPAHAELRLPPQ